MSNPNTMSASEILMAKALHDKGMTWEQVAETMNKDWKVVDHVRRHRAWRLAVGGVLKEAGSRAL